VLDDDAGFRARVAETTSPEAVGRAGWLFLTRPVGWEAELADLAHRAAEDRSRAADRRADSDARRRATAAEEAAAAARDAATRAADALAEERRARRDAARRAGELAARVDALTAERDEARAGAAAARAQHEAARATVARLEARLAERPAPAAPAAPPAPPAAVPDPAATEVVQAAASAARSLADSLEEAVTALGVGTGTERPAARRGTGPRAARPSLTPPDRAVGRRPRRVAAPLPPGVFEESAEAAEHLVRLPEVVVLVDGYNVSHAAWPAAPITDQRRRLVDALAGLVARCGADVRVVFDGADTPEPPAVGTTARSVRVRFSPPGVEADDVILDEVGVIDARRPLVVASSDRRVRDGAREGGANLLHSGQLLDLLRR
jgi:predicted RNA-binding protein with PIN domain